MVWVCVKAILQEVWLCMTSLYCCVHVIHILCSLEEDQRKGHYGKLPEYKMIIFHKNELDLTNKNKQYLPSDFQVCSSLYVTC